MRRRLLRDLSGDNEVSLEVVLVLPAFAGGSVGDGLVPLLLPLLLSEDALAVLPRFPERRALMREAMMSGGERGVDKERDEVERIERMGGADDVLLLYEMVLGRLLVVHRVQTVPLLFDLFAATARWSGVDQERETRVRASPTPHRLFFAREGRGTRRRDPIRSRFE